MMTIDSSIERAGALYSSVENLPVSGIPRQTDEYSSSGAMMNESLERFQRKIAVSEQRLSDRSETGIQRGRGLSHGNDHGIHLDAIQILPYFKVHFRSLSA
jgi:hypothetical protein